MPDNHFQLARRAFDFLLAVFIIIALAALLERWTNADTKAPDIDDMIADAPDCAFVVRGRVLLGTADFTGLARWTVADTDAACVDGPGDRNKSSWHSDPSALAERPIGNADYLHSEYAKGHTSPAADHTETQDATNAAHTLLIAKPQNQEMNAQIWERVEDRRRKLARAGINVRSTTLSIFKMQDNGKTKHGCPRWELDARAVGSNQLWIPTHFATSIRCRDGERTWLENYLIPNNADVAGMDFHSFRVTCDELEFLSNLDLWPCPPHLKGAKRDAWLAEQAAREAAQ